MALLIDHHLLVLLIALVADALVGDPALIYRTIPHPVQAFGTLIRKCEVALNRQTGTDIFRKLAGVATVLLVVSAAAATGWLLHWIFARFEYGWIGEGLAASLFLAQNSLYRHVRQVASDLEGSGLEAGRRAVGMIVGRDPKTLDEPAVSRAAIESLAENFSDGVTAPVFWTLLLGLPGLIAYKALNTADSMIGYRSERYRHFGWAAARMDDVANWIPARLSALLIAAAAWLLPSTKGAAALLATLCDARKSVSPNAGYPEAAMAGALGLKLAGPRLYGDDRVQADWIGKGRTEATPADIRRALLVYLVACVSLIASIALAYAVIRVSA